ncbi:hypothetical protein P5673_009401 [Acropora cervicornis]|uniref:Uncharacterized protein n=1 Tax=Acropora cervicornis TaxID=6130 RepID=A0AAD9QSK1_ACRCE|nr:hypothetical protein P5673_009401 [Acropora cervicornis]
MYMVQNKREIQLSEQEKRHQLGFCVPRRT